MTNFLKMHGLGNDFVVLDARKKPLPNLDWKRLADRHFGIGCDQVIILEASREADVFMRIYNADGGEVASCGNASRCIGWLIMDEKNATQATIETTAGFLRCVSAGECEVTVDMGAPRTDWRDIPLAREMNTLHLRIEQGMLKDPAAVSMGNPHMVFFMPDANDVPLDQLGQILEHHPLFPERANVSVAQLDSSGKITLRVWERGAGLTLACGTAACAALVAASLRGLMGRKASVKLPGGVLQIDWSEKTGHVMMTGAVATSFSGTFDAKDYQP